MQLRLPRDSETENDNEDFQPETSEEIRVIIHPATRPPFFVQRHELTKWSEEFNEEIENGELWLVDGFYENWDEVQDCISLLKGWEVQVTFDNIKVITTFSLRFRIDPLLEELGSWFRTNLNAENFGRVLKTIDMLGKLGFSAEYLNSKSKVTQAVMDFVNNLPKFRFKTLLIALFDDFDQVVINTLFKAENNHLDVLLEVLVEKIDSNDKCKIIVDLFGKILKSEEADVLGVFYMEVTEILEKIVNVSSDTGILKSVYACRTSIQSKAHIASPQNIRLELLRRTRCWREYSVDEIMQLKYNPNLECWHLAEIVLDWIEGYERINFLILSKLRQTVFHGLDVSMSKHWSAELYDYSAHIKRKFNMVCSASLPVCSGAMRDFLAYYLKIFSTYFCQTIKSAIKSPCKFFMFIGELLLLFAIMWTFKDFISDLVDEIKCQFRADGNSSDCPTEKLSFVFYTIVAVFLFSFSTIVCCPGHTIIPILHKGGVFHLFQKRVYLALGQHNLSRLANSSTVKTNPYFRYFIARLIPFSRAELRLLNMNGTVKFALRNKYNAAMDYEIFH